MMNLKIRQEKPEDFAEVNKLVEEAFKEVEFSDQTEHILVERLRKSKAYIPELSIIAKIENEIVGHILLTKININNENNTFVSLGLAPVSVKPKYQNMGIGGKLIMESHKVAIILAYKSIILLGHENYYPKFGYKLTKNYGISLPYDVPEENCMAIELVKDSLKHINGVVEYPNEFYDLKIN